MAVALRLAEIRAGFVVDWPGDANLTFDARCTALFTRHIQSTQIHIQWYQSYGHVLSVREERRIADERSIKWSEMLARACRTHIFC